MHSPPRKISAQDQQLWKIPPCISNWKNAKGYTIPLDKRIAADGRGLQEVSVNDNFAAFSESLYIAERKAREEIRIREELKKKVMLQEKERKESELRNMAQQARMERSGIMSNSVPTNQNNPSFKEEIDEEEIAEEQRERLRIERRKERERDLRLENMKGKEKRSKLDREKSRDISEKIALGIHKGNEVSKDTLYDSRLFNLSGGIDPGFGNEDDYNLYTKHLFDSHQSETIYRPKKNDDEAYGNVDEQLNKIKNTDRFKPEKGFKGTEDGNKRDGPVQFEKPNSVVANNNPDVFGIKPIIPKRKRSSSISQSDNDSK